MRVLHFYKTSFPDSMGGVEQFIAQISAGVNKFGIKTDVLSLAKDPKPQIHENESHRSHRAKLDFQIASTGFSTSAFSQFSKLAQQADLIHYHFPWPFMDLVHFATQIQRPTLVTYHSDIIRQKYLLKLYRPLMHRFLDSVDCIVTTSENYRSSSDVLSGYKDKVSVIPIGLDKASYPKPSFEKLHYWRTKLGPKFLLFVGVIRYYKGLHILLDALAGTEYPVVIVGSGPAEEALKAQATRLGLKQVHFLGALSDEDKVALLKLCYGFLFPSHVRSEAFGIGLLEAAMYGKPMISCEIGTGTSYINADRETGIVVPPNNAHAFSQAIHYLWEHPEEASIMGEQAAKRYLRLFQAQQMVRSYIDLYSALSPEFSKLNLRSAGF